MTIDSELPLLLPELSGTVGSPDVEVRRATIEPSDGAPGLPVDLKGIEARIPDDSTLVVDPKRQAAPIVSRVVLKICLPALLFDRGATILHAGAVDAGGRGVAFTGQQDAGKSSLVTAMCQRGHRFLTDDVLAVVEADGAQRAVPSFPRTSLSLETRDALGFDGQRVAAIDDRPEDWFDIEDQFGTEPAQIDVLYVLEERGGMDSPEIRTLDGQAAMERLPRHVIQFPGLETSDSLARLFHQCTDLCQSVPVKLLERPDGFEAMADVVGHIEEDVEAL
jgi:hypothetical protein